MLGDVVWLKVGQAKNFCSGLCAGQSSSSTSDSVKHFFSAIVVCTEALSCQSRKVTPYPTTKCLSKMIAWLHASLTKKDKAFHYKGVSTYFYILTVWASLSFDNSFEPQRVFFITHSSNVHSSNHCHYA